jgi:hypothetical protein
MPRANLFRIDAKPWWDSRLGVAYSFNSFKIADAGHKLAWIFQIKEPASITHVGFRYNNGSDSTGGGVPPTYRISFRNVDGDGDFSENVISSQTFTPNKTWDGTWRWIELASPVSFPRRFIAVVIEYHTGLIGSNNWSQFTERILGAHAAQSNFPYSIQTTSTKVRNSEAIVVGYKNNQRSWGWPFQSMSSDNVNSPAQVALRFWLDPGFGSVFQVVGSRFQGRLAGGSGKTIDMVLYQGTTELTRVTLDCDIAGSATTQDEVVNLLFTGTPPTLTMGTEYFLAFSPNEANTNFQLRSFTTPSALDVSALPGGIQFYWSERSNTVSEWTRVKNKRPQANLILGSWTE